MMKLLARGWGIAWILSVSWLGGVLAVSAERSSAGEGQGATYWGKPARYWIAEAERRREPPERIVRALTLVLGDPRPEVVRDAADGLARFGPQAASAAGALTGLLADKHPWVRVAAMETLAGIGPEAVPPLVEAFQRGEGAVRVRALLVLGSMGPAARAAIPALEAAARDARSDIRDRVIQNLELIRPSGPDEGGRAARRPVRTGPLRLRPEEIGGPPEDWPQFHGPRRDSVCGETGLLPEWPPGGPPLVWKRDGLGRGYSTVSIAGGRLFTMGDRPLAGGGEAQFALAFDLQAARPLWATPVGPPHEDGGPRCTPTVAGNWVYVLGTDGDLVCLDAATGTIVWQKNLVEDFGGEMMSGWKYSESPLVDGDLVICTPGGPEATLVALHKDSGELVWKCPVPDLGPRGKDGAGYASMVVAEIQGRRQYVQLIGRGVVGVDAETGRFLWGYNDIANSIANIPTPVVRDNLVFATTGYRSGCVLLRIQRQGGRFWAEEVYRLGPRDFENHHGGVVLAGDFLYGGSGTNKGQPVCLELATGRIAWKPAPLARGSAAVLYADGHLIFRYDRGLVAWIEAAPEAFRVRGTLDPILGDGPAWPHPVIHRGRLYLRHGDLLLCYDLRKRG